MRKRLSSRMTLIAKFALPAFWIVGFGWVAFAHFLRRVDGPHQAAWLFLIMALGGVFMFGLTSFGLKWVWLGDEVLIVSNIWRRESIPLGNIAKVRMWPTGPSGLPQRISIDFAQPTAFGKSIYFLPLLRFSQNWSGHPVIAELRDAVLSAAGTSNLTERQEPT